MEEKTIIAKEENFPALESLERKLIEIQEKENEENKLKAKAEVFVESLKAKIGDNDEVFIEFATGQLVNITSVGIGVFDGDTYKPLIPDSDFYEILQISQCEVKDLNFVG
ncbi:MAG: hypothetical protein U9Q27_00800 [Patescibacteria group bacterium]|nr:hypothetical protein [Patescibacteria group bacterium]